ncbi:ATP-binding cassette domain-containing protein [Roseomonas haemaphysalidis]|uniref:ATP-binding cassette domain-containing protein n=2 Tax=Roseomonas haemaphysalidis TaxID=2768162 RepID=A0ABS3KVW9_9PROT|nr:ATP-binding cassette domain-containing protein [Roseomonas haemaphysalidis]MBO1081623.1 ATP-binding cassette domain-containing protein [Roseomonas haemaphysalidis]
MTGAPFYELRDTGFAVPGRTLLHPLRLTLPAGRIIGLVGHNGSGKSTLLKLLSRQQAPTTGSLLFGGRPLRDWGTREYAQRVAYLPQHMPATDGMQVCELVAQGRYPWHGALGRFGATDRAKVAEALALSGLEPLAGRVVDSLSGGERQRAWLAMLIAQDAGCLLLDEPTAALDLAHQIEVLELVQHFSRERGTGAVVVLHDINMAARYCDDILALRRGQLIFRGAPNELMNPGQLEAIYGLPLEVLRHPLTKRPIAVVP